jgi:hypothetical protein
MENTLVKIEDLTNTIKEYVSLRYVEAVDSVKQIFSTIASLIISGIFILLFVFIFILFTSLAVASYASEWYGHQWFGYALIAIFYLLLMIIFWYLKAKLFKLPNTKSNVKNIEIK